MKLSQIARSDAAVVGVGDDAAAWRVSPGALAVVSTDSLVEDVDFRRSYQSPYQVGWKAWRAAVCDLAAMGANAGGGLLAALVPAETSLTALRAIQLGLVEAAAEDGAVVLGGDLSGTAGPLALTVTVLGELGDRDPVRLGGGSPGDALLVTGSLGLAAAALERLERGCAELAPEWRDRLLEPRSRLEAGQALRRLGASAMTDISDGLLLDAARIGAASGVGVEIWLDRVPLGAGLERDEAGCSLALSGGEDYELLATIAEIRRGPALRGWGSHLPPISQIGRLTEEHGVRLLSRPGGEPMALPERDGFRHF
jgi:thiamine-monophosphate kinase